MIVLLRTQPKFPLGCLVMTRGAEASLTTFDVFRALARHATGDWGDLDDHDRNANNEALADGTRILSAYTTRQGVRFWIITEADRSVTTVLLPDEY